MVFVEMHQWWAWVMVLSNAAAGSWALAAHWVPSLRRQSLWLLTIAAQVSVAIQAVLGVLALQTGEGEVAELHMVYGFVTLAAVGILYSYRQQIMQWQYLLYGGGGLFLMGMGIREMIL